MAAPHAAGAFALLRQAVPGATVGEALHALQVSDGPSLTSRESPDRASISMRP